MSFAIPESAWPRCLECGEPVRPGGRVLHEVTGFEAERTQGGTNHVIARRRTGRVVGGCCAERVRSGVPRTQESLL